MLFITIYWQKYEAFCNACPLNDEQKKKNWFLLPVKRWTWYMLSMFYIHCISLPVFPFPVFISIFPSVGIQPCNGSTFILPCLWCPSVFMIMFHWYYFFLDAQALRIHPAVCLLTCGPYGFRFSFRSNPEKLGAVHRWPLTSASPCGFWHLNFVLHIYICCLW